MKFKGSITGAWMNPIRIIVRIQEPGLVGLHRILEFQRDIWRSYGRISMKFYGSIAVGICRIWLRFQPDPDQSPDPDMYSKLQGG